MTKTSTWRVKEGCRKCKSPAYYYPAKLLLEVTGFREAPDETSKRTISCTCTGENDNVKHTLDYSFPSEFEKIE
jgi:hypothetical protein